MPLFYLEPDMTLEAQVHPRKVLQIEPTFIL